MKGSSFEPVRVKSATIRKTTHKVPTRPQTAFAKRDSTIAYIPAKEEDKGMFYLRVVSIHFLREENIF